MEVPGFKVSLNDPSVFKCSPYGAVGSPVVHPTWQQIQAARAPPKPTGSPTSVNSASPKTPPSITIPWIWRRIIPELADLFPLADEVEANKKVKPTPTPEQLASRVPPCSKCGYKYLFTKKCRPGPNAAQEYWPMSYPSHPCPFPKYSPRIERKPGGPRFEEDKEDILE
jgi:hypothetical protein